MGSKVMGGLSQASEGLGSSRNLKEPSGAWFLGPPGVVPPPKIPQWRLALLVIKKLPLALLVVKIAFGVLSCQQMLSA